jgi:hypothetical protein
MWRSGKRSQPQQSFRSTSPGAAMQEQVNRWHRANVVFVEAYSDPRGKPERERVLYPVRKLVDQMHLELLRAVRTNR